ncbi:MAG: hypothetical protein AMXMBFR23_04680 [Chloroflexota bacterium]
MARTRGFAVRLTILLGVVLGTFAAGPSASAEGPVALYFGFILPAADEPLPLRVRVTSQTGTVCGTATVDASSGNRGFYVVGVFSHAERAGCPAEGEPLLFRFLYDLIDDGVQATPLGAPRSVNPTLVVGGQIRVDLIADPDSPVIDLGGWSGVRPPSGGVALLTWAGPENTPVDQAVQTLGIEVVGVWHLPPGTQRFVSYIPGAPAFAQTYHTVHTGEIVFVRAR